MFLDLVGTLVARVLVLVSGVATGIITANSLGPEGRGNYFLIVTLAQLCVQIGHFGLASSNTYLVSKDKAKLRALAANSLWVAALSGVACSTVAIVLALPPLGDGVGPEHAALLLMVPTTIYGLLSSNLLIGIGLTAWYNISTIFSSLLQLIAVSTAAYLRLDFVWMVWISAAASTVSAATFYFMLNRLGASYWPIDVGQFLGNIPYSMKVYFATFVPFAVARLNVAFVNYTGGAAEVGLYSVAAQIFDVLMIVPGSVALLIFPHLARDESAGSWYRTVKVTISVASAVAAGAIAIGFSAHYFLPLLFGERFAPAVPILLAMLPGAIAFAALNILSQYLAAVGFPAATMWSWSGCLALLGILDTFLVPQFGALGAAASLSVAYAALAIALSAVATFHAWRPAELKSIKRTSRTWTRF